MQQFPYTFDCIKTVVMCLKKKKKIKGGKRRGKRRKVKQKTTKKGKYRMHVARKLSRKVLRILVPKLGNSSSFLK